MSTPSKLSFCVSTCSLSSSPFDTRYLLLCCFVFGLSLFVLFFCQGVHFSHILIVLPARYYDPRSPRADFAFCPPFCPLSSTVAVCFSVDIFVLSSSSSSLSLFLSPFIPYRLDVGTICSRYDTVLGPMTWVRTLWITWTSTPALRRQITLWSIYTLWQYTHSLISYWQNCPHTTAALSLYSCWRDCKIGLVHHPKQRNIRSDRPHITLLSSTRQRQSLPPIQLMLLPPLYPCLSACCHALNRYDTGNWTQDSWVTFNLERPFPVPPPDQHLLVEFGYLRLG